MARTSPNGSERLAALGALKVLDTSPERQFDDLVEAAAPACDVPISLLSPSDAARVMGPKTVAEFVDDPRTSIRVREFGIDCAQGILPHQPEPIGGRIPCSNRVAIGASVRA